jgi:hypothetical protein
MPEYSDEDFVYVDPKTRQVVGLVEWTTNGTPIPLEMKLPEPEVDEEGEKRRKFRKPRKRYYPWGQYRTMKKLYKIEGKQKDAESYIDLDEAMKKAVQEPYWD